MKSHYYILAEIINEEGFVLEKMFTDRRSALNRLSKLHNHFYHSKRPEEEIIRDLRNVQNVERYDFLFADTVITMQGMVLFEGKKVNTYLLKSEVEITNFFNLPRISKKVSDQSKSDCDFPF